jgi:hypothetical protein
MAQTKRKRRTKHRGNAAGAIEARGRTGRRPTASERKPLTRAEAREQRLNRPPTWKSALTKAGLMAALLFLFTQIGLLGSELSLAQSVLLCAMALALYTPLAYATDRWVYNRAQRRRAQQAKR